MSIYISGKIVLKAKKYLKYTQVLYGKRLVDFTEDFALNSEI